MTMEMIVEMLGYALGHFLVVTVTLRDGTIVEGCPTSIDTHPTAMEVFLQPVAGGETEIGLSLTAIASVTME